MTELLDADRAVAAHCLDLSALFDRVGATYAGEMAAGELNAWGNSFPAEKMPFGQRVLVNGIPYALGPKLSPDHPETPCTLPTPDHPETLCEAPTPDHLEALGQRLPGGPPAVPITGLAVLAAGELGAQPLTLHLHLDPALDPAPGDLPEAGLAATYEVTLAVNGWAAHPGAPISPGEVRFESLHYPAGYALSMLLPALWSIHTPLPGIPVRSIELLPNPLVHIFAITLLTRPGVKGQAEPGIGCGGQTEGEAEGDAEVRADVRAAGGAEGRAEGRAARQANAGPTTPIEAEPEKSAPTQAKDGGISRKEAASESEAQGEADEPVDTRAGGRPVGGQAVSSQAVSAQAVGGQPISNQPASNQAVSNQSLGRSQRRDPVTIAPPSGWSPAVSTLYQNIATLAAAQSPRSWALRLGLSWGFGFPVGERTRLTEFSLPLEPYKPLPTILSERGGLRIGIHDDPDGTAMDEYLSSTANSVIAVVDSHDLPYRPAFGRVHSSRTVIVTADPNDHAQVIVEDHWEPTYSGHLHRRDLAWSRRSAAVAEPALEPIFDRLLGPAQWFTVEQDPLPVDDPGEWSRRMLATLVSDLVAPAADRRDGVIFGLDAMRACLEQLRHPDSGEVPGSIRSRRRIALTLRAELSRRHYLCPALRILLTLAGRADLIIEIDRYERELWRFQAARDTLVKTLRPALLGRGPRPEYDLYLLTQAQRAFSAEERLAETIGQQVAPATLCMITKGFGGQGG